MTTTGDAVTSNALLDVRSLTVHLEVHGRLIRAADSVDLHVNPGECVGLVGESGSGKTMVARAIAGLLPAVKLATIAGQVVLAGQDLMKLNPAQIRVARRGRVSMIFQEPTSYLNPTMRVGKQIAEALPPGIDRRHSKQVIDQLLIKAGLPGGRGLDRSYPHQLSGGMKQRAMIALALASEPKLLIADEPTTALDVTVQAQVLDTLRKLHRDGGMSILIITHDFGVIAEMCDRVYVMYAGQIVEAADAVELFEAPRHPYTVALLNGLPGRAGRSETAEVLKGSIPDLGMLGEGCRFAPRCSFAREACRSDQALRISGDGHAVRCVLEDSRASGPSVTPAPQPAQAEPR